MSDVSDEHKSAPHGDELRPEWGILIPSLVVVLLISIPAVWIPKETEDFFKAIYNPLAFNFGTLYLWITVSLIAMCFYYALSRWGNIKFVLYSALKLY